VFPVRYDLNLYIYVEESRPPLSAGLRPKSDCSGKAQKQLYSNLQTRPLVREGILTD
jgi:hypothetical protein